MYGKKRLKREPDPFQKTFAGLFERLSGLGLVVSLSLVGLLVLMGVLGFTSCRSSRQDTAAWARYAEIVKLPDPAERVDRLEKFAAEAAGSSVRPVALLEAAAMLRGRAANAPADAKGRREDDLKRARGLLDTFLADYPRHRLVVIAREQLGLVLEDAGLYQEALDAFQAAEAAAKERGFQFMVGKLLYGQARCELKLDRRDQAVKLLEQCLAETASGAGGEWEMAARGLRATVRPAAAGKPLLVPGAAKDQPAEEPKPAPGGDQPKAPEKAGDGKKPSGS